MDDPLLVGFGKRFGDLPRDAKGFLERNRPFLDALSERRPLDELEHQEQPAVVFFETVDGRDVGMVERGQHLRLALEALQPLFVTGESFGKDFDRDLALQLGVISAIHLPHAALAEQAEDAVGIQTGAGGKQYRRIVNPARKIPQRGNGSDVV